MAISGDVAVMSPLMPISSTASGNTSGSRISASSSRVRPRSRRRTVCNLAHHDVMIEAVPLRQARGQQFQQRSHIEAAY